MPKGVKNGPQHLRLISRNEAAVILECSTQTISNWVERGIIKGHKIDNMLFVDKESIEKLFDTASDVAEMEKKLEELRKIINNEIQQEEQKVKRLYEDGQRTIQDKFFKELTDSIVDTVKDRLSEREFFIVSGVLKGKPTLEIAREVGCTMETVRYNWRRIAPKLFEILEYPTVRREKEDLAEENQALKDEIRRLKTDHRERDLLATPFARELLEFGFSPPICRRLMSSGVKTLADLLQYDVTRLLNLPNMGSTSVRKIKEHLDTMGLSLGMDLQNMSDQKYEALVEKVNDFLPSKGRSNTNNVRLLKEEILQLKEKVRELNITNAQLKHELSELNRDAISKESLLDRISSLESLVRYYIKERRVLFKKMKLPI